MAESLELRAEPVDMVASLAIDRRAGEDDADGRGCGLWHRSTVLVNSEKPKRLTSNGSISNVLVVGSKTSGEGKDR